MTGATGLSRPAWRRLLESRWQRRLAAVIRLSVAYHDADAPQVRRLMRETVAARRALSDTEEALARLSAGSYGRCEQCGTAIPLAELVAEPEARYCEGCARGGARGSARGGARGGARGREVARWRG